MTDAPAKIWAYRFENGDNVWFDRDAPQTGRTQYLRSDVAQAMVAAAYEDAAQMASPSCVKQLTPASARAALDALLKAEREKALREAAEVCDNAPAKPNQAGENKEVESAHWCAAMIRALIDEDKADGCKPSCECPDCNE